MTCAQGLLRLLWGGGRSWSATGLMMSMSGCTSKQQFLFRLSKQVGKNDFVLRLIMKKELCNGTIGLVQELKRVKKVVFKLR